MDESQPTANGRHFDTLVRRGKEASSEETVSACLKALWTDLLALEHWIFLTTAGEDPEAATPFIGMIEDKPWIMVFTDPYKAAEFAGGDPRFRASDGALLFMEVPLDTALRWALGLAEYGVFGIRINQGEYGWFSPLSELPAIVSFVRGQD